MPAEIHENSPISPLSIQTKIILHRYTAQYIYTLYIMDIPIYNPVESICDESCVKKL